MGNEEEFKYMEEGYADMKVGDKVRVKTWDEMLECDNTFVETDEYTGEQKIYFISSSGNFHHVTFTEAKEKEFSNTIDIIREVSEIGTAFLNNSKEIFYIGMFELC